jgi:hypothetical protein
MIMIASNVTKADAAALSGQDDWAEGRPDLRLSTGREPLLVTKPGRLTEHFSKPEGNRLTSAATTKTTAPPVEAADAAAAKASLSLTRPAPDLEGRQVLRAHFSREILRALQQIQRYSRKPEAAGYAGVLLRNMRAMQDRCVGDPFVGVVLALHDALAYENRWADFEARQYEGAYEVLKALAERPSVGDQQAEKAIMELGELGFETTPFELPDELFDGEGEEELEAS